MRVRPGKLSPPNPGPTVAIAVLAALSLVGVLALSLQHVPEAIWLVLGSSLLVIAAAHFRFARSWTRRVRRVVEAMRCIAEGSDPESFRGGPVADAVDSLGWEVRKAVAELSETMKSLGEDKRRAELVLANMADGIMAIGCDKRVSLFNRAAGLLLGEKESRVLGNKLEDVDLHPEIARVADECISAKNDVVSEIQLPGRPQRVVGLRGTPLGTADSISDCAIIILHDLTEIRHHDKVQKEFVSNVGHELRTPLTAVRTTAEALLSGAKNDQAMLDRFLNTIISESDRLSTLIDDLTEIVRISSGITKTEKAECNVAEIVAQALEVVRPQAEVRNIAIRVDVDEALTGCCDGMQMIHVVRNLVDNAVKYTREGGGVELTAGTQDSQLVIRVKDTGIGIPHGEIDRIFDRFYRVDKARSRQIGGTGLGLAIVKEIVEAHGGEISVETELGKGSTFTVRLPPATEARAARAARPHRSRHSEPAKNLTRRGRDSSLRSE